MSPKPVSVGLLLVALALLAWMLWPGGESEGPSPSGSDVPAEERDGSTFRATPSSGHRPIGANGGSRPEGSRPAARRPSADSGRKSDERRPGRRPTAGRAMIRGLAAVPAELWREVPRMQMHVTRSYEFDMGAASETWFVTEPIRGDGTYELAGLEPGRYFLQVVLDGRALSEPLRLSLTKGQVAGGRDFRFEREAVAKGRVFAQLSAAPLAGAEVRVSDGPPERTDEEGAFTLYDLPPGEHELFVVHPDHAPARATVRIKKDEASAEVSVYLPPGAHARIEALAPDGSPRAGVGITLSNADHLVGAETDEHGVALFKGLTPGASYRVRLPGRRLDGRMTLLVPELEAVREVKLTLRED